MWISKRKFEARMDNLYSTVEQNNTKTRVRIEELEEAVGHLYTALGYKLVRLKPDDINSIFKTFQLEKLDD